MSGSGRRDRRLARRGTVAVALLGLAACTSPVVAPCPGEQVATLRFSGEPDLDGGCPFAADAGPLGFTGTIAYGASGDALLCLDQPHAEPLRGTHDGDHVVLSSAAAAATVSACPCSPRVTESLEGDLLRPDGGPVGFDGGLRDDFVTGDGGPVCTPDAGCGIPCAQRWRVTGAPP